MQVRNEHTVIILADVNTSSLYDTYWVRAGAHTKNFV